MYIYINIGINKQIYIYIYISIIISQYLTISDGQSMLNQPPPDPWPPSPGSESYSQKSGAGGTRAAAGTPGIAWSAVGHRHLSHSTYPT